MVGIVEKEENYFRMTASLHFKMTLEDVESSLLHKASPMLNLDQAILGFALEAHFK